MNVELATKRLLELFKESGEKTLLARSSINMFCENLRSEDLSSEERIRNEEMCRHHTTVGNDSFHVHCELNYILRHYLDVEPEVLTGIQEDLNNRYKTEEE